jgi:hypothetical protein
MISKKKEDSNKVTRSQQTNSPPLQAISSGHRAPAHEHQASTPLATGQSVNCAPLWPSSRLPLVSFRLLYVLQPELQRAQSKLPATALLRSANELLATARTPVQAVPRVQALALLNIKTYIQRLKTRVKWVFWKKLLMENVKRRWHMWVTFAQPTTLIVLDFLQ